MDINKHIVDQRIRKIVADNSDRCLEAGRLSPSANNAQDWTFVVVDDGELKTRVAESAYRFGGAFVKQAPVIIVLVTEKPLFMSKFDSVLRKIDFSSLDMGNAAAHICLQAADLGLGTCMLESFDEKSIKNLARHSGQPPCRSVDYSWIPRR